MKYRSRKSPIACNTFPHYAHARYAASKEAGVIWYTPEMIRNDLHRALYRQKALSEIECAVNFEVWGSDGPMCSAAEMR